MPEHRGSVCPYLEYSEFKYLSRDRLFSLLFPVGLPSVSLQMPE